MNDAVKPTPAPDEYIVVSASSDGGLEDRINEIPGGVVEAVGLGKDGALIAVVRAPAGTRKQRTDEATARFLGAYGDKSAT